MAVLGLLAITRWRILLRWSLRGEVTLLPPSSTGFRTRQSTQRKSTISKQQLDGCERTPRAITSIQTASPPLEHQQVGTLWLCWVLRMKCGTLKVMEAIKVSPAWFSPLLISMALLHLSIPATSTKKRKGRSTLTRD